MIGSIYPISYDERQQRIAPNEYHGWTIWKWTGWKGEKVTAQCDSRYDCRICHQPILADQVLREDHRDELVHWICAYPDNRLERFYGQWLARKGPNTQSRHLYVCVGGDPITEGEYERGVCFELGAPLVTEETLYSERERIKAEGLQQLFRLIDRVNVGESA
jgi:hypothetical protein